MCLVHQVLPTARGVPRVVTHPGTNPARRCLTSVIWREPVCHRRLAVDCSAMFPPRSSPGAWSSWWKVFQWLVVRVHEPDRPLMIRFHFNNRAGTGTVHVQVHDALRRFAGRGVRNHSHWSWSEGNYCEVNAFRVADNVRGICSPQWHNVAICKDLYMKLGTMFLHVTIKLLHNSKSKQSTPKCPWMNHRI